MKIAARRRLALAGLATSTAVVAGVLVLPGTASAAAITDVSPGTVLNTNTGQTLTFTHPTPLVSGTYTLTRTGAPADTITGQFVPAAPGRSTTAQPVNFADGGDARATDGPANPGTYDVALSNPGGSDTCTACFTVASPGVPTVTAVAPDGLTQASSGNVTVTGTNFSRGSVLQVLRLDGSVDPEITTAGGPVEPNTAGQNAEVTNGITTSTTLRRRFVVSASAVTGPRLVRVVNTDGTSAQCASTCFRVNGAPLTAVSPTGGTNNPTPATPTVTLTFRGAGLEAGVPSLAFVGDAGSSTKADLSIVGQNPVFAADKQSVRAEYDLRNAAPGLDAYQPTLTQSDGTVNACVAACRFDVLQTAPAAVTAVTPPNGVAGATQTVQITGTGFSRGVRIDVGGGEVTTTSVRFVSPTRVDAVLAVGPNAVNGARNVTPTTTDGRAGTACTGCFTVTGGRTSPSATPSVSPTGSASPTPSASPSGRTASVSVEPTTIVSQQTARVLGTATPGSVVELLAYSRPSTTYQVVRRGVVGQTGRIEFVVGPSGNTRLYLRATDEAGRDAVDSASVVLTVRTSLNLKVTRTGTRTYRFTGSTLPKRRGQLVTVFYETASGSRTIAARARVAENGTYDVTRQFSGTGTFVLFTGTGTDINNASNTSNRVRVAIR